jgi:uncharacterized SAM-binding protein YcdF (DUF218 family)
MIQPRAGGRGAKPNNRKRLIINSWQIKRDLKKFLIITGIVSSLMVVLAFTPLPFHVWYRLSMKKAGIHRPPEYIIVLGGGGMPSESGLIRCWYAATAAIHFNRAKIIVALPGDTASENSSVTLMKKELIIRGVEPSRIFYESQGANTRAQAVNIAEKSTNDERRTTKDLSAPTSYFVLRTSYFLIVTSPEHLYRAVLTFKKAGFSKVDGLPSFERAIESDMLFDGGKLGGRKYIPDVGGSITLRYGFWTQINYEFLVLREWVALAYYKLKGWV